MWYIIGTIVLFCTCFYFYFGHIAVMLFWKCIKLDLKINYLELAIMKKNKVNIDKLLKYAVKLKEEGGYNIKIKDLMQHEQSGGDIPNVMKLLLTAKKKKTELTYQQAAIIDMDEVNKRKKNLAKAQQEQSNPQESEQPVSQPQNQE